MAAERTAPVDHSVQYLTIIDMTVTYCSDESGREPYTTVQDMAVSCFSQ
jgi:hypothetical protein